MHARRCAGATGFTTKHPLNWRVSLHSMCRDTYIEVCMRTSTDMCICKRADMHNEVYLCAIVRADKHPKRACV